jgi:hypothetical protein
MLSLKSGLRKLAVEPTLLRCARNLAMSMIYRAFAPPRKPREKRTSEVFTSS